AATGSGFAGSSPMTETLSPFTRLCAVGVALLAASPARAADPAFQKQTYTFKAAGDLKIQADVYRADDVKVRPVVVWIHGGGLIMGNREGVPQNLLDLCRDEGDALGSPHYRPPPAGEPPHHNPDGEDGLPLPPRPPAAAGHP